MKKDHRLWVVPTIAAFLTLPCCAWFLAFDIPPEPFTMAQLQDVFDRELAIYEDAGLRETDSGTARLGDTITLTLEGGQCIGVVTASVSAWPAETSLLTRDNTLLTRADRTHVSSVAWCDPFATRLSIVFSADWQASLAHTAQTLEGTVHYRVFTGRTDAFDLTTLPRGRPVEVHRAERIARIEADRATLAEREDLPDGEPLFDAVRVSTEQGALLIPRSPTTWESYRAASVRYTSVAASDVFPRVHEASIGDAGEAAATEALIEIDDEPFRVLAVVDPADLPVQGRVPCATLRFGRLASEPGEVSRFDLASTEALPSQGIIASDSFCPTDSPRLYIVPATDLRDYVVRAFPTGDAMAARRAGNVLEAPPYPPLVEALDACGQTGDRCMEAARELRDGGHVPVDEPQARDLLRRGCEADPNACAEYAAHLLSRDDETLDVDAAEALRRACDSRNWNACGRLGDLRRLGRGVDVDYDLANTLYQRACEQDVQTACQNANTLELLLLLNLPESEPEPEPEPEPEAEPEAEPEPEVDVESESDAEDAPGVAADE